MKTPSPRYLRPLVFLSAVFALSLSWPVSAQTFGNIIKRTVVRSPSNVSPNDPPRELVSYYGCYSMQTGIVLNCTFTHEVVGIEGQTPLQDCVIGSEGQVIQCNAGGHSHNGLRPFVLSDTLIEFENGVDTDPRDEAVAGETKVGGQRRVKLIHTMPEVAGVLRIEGDLRAPLTHPCGARCFDEGGWKLLWKVDVGLPGLRQLPQPDPEPADFYRKVRNPDTKHLDAIAYGATPFAQRALPIIAEFYAFHSGRLLSINDMSLPKGGLFDITGQWVPKHTDHRDGKDADINRFDPEPPFDPLVFCPADTDLRLAVDQVLAGIRLKFDPNTGQFGRTALLCELGGKRHIDLETP